MCTAGGEERSETNTIQCNTRIERRREGRRLYPIRGKREKKEEDEDDVMNEESAAVLIEIL